jgi:hypothetical protein
MIETLVMKECVEKWTGVTIGVMSPGISKLIYIWSKSDPNLCVGSVISWTLTQCCGPLKTG